MKKYVLSSLFTLGILVLGTAQNIASHQWEDRNTDIEQLLIGLNGEYKHRWTGVVDTLLLFVTIDTMPMRQTELKQKNQNQE